MNRATASPQPALVASPSSPQAVSTEGFDQAQGCCHWPGQERCGVCGLDDTERRDALDDGDDDDFEAWWSDR